jgi:hypothetical protein
VFTSGRQERSQARPVEGMGGCDGDGCIDWQVAVGEHFDGPQAWCRWRAYVSVWAVGVFPPAGGQRVKVLEPVGESVGADLYVSLKPGSD